MNELDYISNWVGCSNLMVMNFGQNYFRLAIEFHFHYPVVYYRRKNSKSMYCGSNQPPCYDPNKVKKV